MDSMRIGRSDHTGAEFVQVDDNDEEYGDALVAWCKWDGCVTLSKSDNHHEQFHICDLKRHIKLLQQVQEQCEKKFPGDY